MSQDAHHARPAGLAAALDPSAAPVPFVHKPRLRAGLEQFKATGQVSDDLAADLLSIARGVYRRAVPTDSEDDFVQDCWLHLVTGAPLRRVDPVDPRALGFLIRCAHSYAAKQRAKFAKECTRRAELRELCEQHVRPATSRAGGQRSKYAEIHGLNCDAPDEPSLIATIR